MREIARLQLASILTTQGVPTIFSNTAIFVSLHKDRGQSWSEDKIAIHQACLLTAGSVRQSYSTSARDRDHALIQTLKQVTCYRTGTFNSV